jgi:hypothetical protein
MKLTNILNELVFEGLNLSKRPRPVFVKLPNRLEEFLQDIAQMIGDIDYNDIHKFSNILTPEKLTKLKELYWDLREKLLQFDLINDHVEIKKTPKYQELISLVKDDNLYEGLNLPKKQIKYYIGLGMAPNPDHYGYEYEQYKKEGLHYIGVYSIEEALELQRKYINENGLGGGNYIGGIILNANKKPIARVSYNGRIWENTPWTPNTKEYHIVNGELVEKPNLSEGLNLLNIKDLPVLYARDLITDLVDHVKKDKQQHIMYYDKNSRVVMDYNNKTGKERSGWLNISSENIYQPIERKFPELNAYDLMAPVIEKGLKKITKFKIPDFTYLNNVSDIERLWYRRD